MRTIDKKPADAVRPAIVAGMGILTAVACFGLLLRLAQITPHVGDIVAFVPSATAPAGENTRLLVQRQDQFGCVLDMNVLRHSGGSLVIETQLGPEAKSFRVHWAGARTSADAGNCGSDADLIVDALDLNVLSFSAGGYGVNPTEGRTIAGYGVNPVDGRIITGFVN